MSSTQQYSLLEMLPQECFDRILDFALDPELANCAASACCLQRRGHFPGWLTTCRALTTSALSWYERTQELVVQVPSLKCREGLCHRFSKPFLQHVRKVRLEFSQGEFNAMNDQLAEYCKLKRLTDIWMDQNRLDEVILSVPPDFAALLQVKATFRPMRCFEEYFQPLIDVLGSIVQWRPYCVNTMLMTVGPAMQDEQALKLMIDRTDDLNRRDGHGLTALHYFVRTRRTSSLRLLLNAPGLDINRPATGYIGAKRAPLTYAVLSRCSDDIVEMLLSRGANKNMQDCFRRTARDYAEVIGKHGTIRLLTREGE